MPLRILKIVISSCFIAAAFVYMVFCLMALYNPKNATSGILTITFNIPNINLRDTTIMPTKRGDDDLGGIFASVQNEFQSITSFVASASPSAVSNAINAAETAVNALIPKNCTLGTDYLCVGYGDNFPCTHLPLNTSNPISGVLSELSADQLPGLLSLSSSLETADQAISSIVKRNFRKFFILGLIMSIFAIIFGTLFMGSIWWEKARAERSVLGIHIPLVPIVRIILSFVCLLALSIPTGFILALKSGSSKLPANTEFGQVKDAGIGAVIVAGFMLISSMVSEFL